MLPVLKSRIYIGDCCYCWGSCLALGALFQELLPVRQISTQLTYHQMALPQKNIMTIKAVKFKLLQHLAPNRISVDIENIPLILQHAFVAIEDERFYEHNGIDLKGIFRAAMKVLQTGRLSEGGSTLTQQLLKTITLMLLMKQILKN